MSTRPTPLQARLAQVNARISAAAQAVSRDPQEMGLLAVSKTFGAEAVVEALAAGQSCFGENYVQEGIDKIERVRILAPQATVEWHFIGPLQSNKTRDVAQYFDWVHSVDRLKIAQRLGAQRPENRPPLNVLIQVNISAEASKSGVAPAEVQALVGAILPLPHLQLRGLMAIPEPTTDAEVQRRAFEAMQKLFLDVRTQQGAWLKKWDTLSLGMSADLEAAIRAGSTLVRVGSAIFGGRT